jgi:putative pyoverdin transport system ATP-binding/permease protein
MTFLQLIRREIHGSFPKLILVSAVGGVSNATILAAINAATSEISDGKHPSLWSVALFLASLYLFLKSQLYVTITTTAEIEGIIHKVRLRLLDKIRQSELLTIEGIGRAGIVAAITGDTNVLTQASMLLCLSTQSLVLVFFITMYVAYLSFAAFAISILVVGVAVAFFHARNLRMAAEKQEAVQREERLFDRLSDFLDGFKEVRLNTARANDLYDDAVEVSRTAANIKIRTQTETFKQMVTTQAAFYVLLGAVVFIAPRLNEALKGTSLSGMTMALLFVVGNAFGLVQSIPILQNADAAADRIGRMEEALRVAAPTPRELPGARHFDQIELHSVVFHYVDRSSEVTFQIGPLDFTLRPGELVFITGGNGSGKSTFLRVLAGLYPPDSGELRLDRAVINDKTRNKYRELMSAIFTDYHLFKHLYGIANLHPGEVDRLLTRFRLEGKTSISEGEFRTLDLSGGQRKRLALIVSLLENRPILLLDEWTADQDPEFRFLFYHELLPELMQGGATIVMVTHDDRYLDELHLPARRLRMDEGRFVESRSMENGR